MNSQQWRERAMAVTPGGVHSPVRAFKHVGGGSVFFEKGKGPHLYDVEGNEYVDFCASFGPLILGHAPEVVRTAVQNQLERGTSFGACHPGEVELSEWILKGYPFLEKVRLVNSGTEAVMTAVRLVRGITGRSKIVQFEGGYHGHSDGLLAKAGSGVAALSESSSQGVPHSVVADTLVSQFGDLEGLTRLFETHGKEIAGVVMEPVPANNGLCIPSREYLKGVIELAHSHGALVIFDEVISGFRLGPFGACGYFDLTPDLVTLGKIIGGGFPIGAIAGTAKLMDHLAPEGSVYQAGTLSGNPVATAAGCAVLKSLFENPPYAELEFLTTAFCEGLQEKLGDVEILHIGSVFWINFGDKNESFPPAIDEKAKERYGKFFHHMLKNGAYFAPSPYEVGFISSAHQSQVLNEVLEKGVRC